MLYGAEMQAVRCTHINQTATQNLRSVVYTIYYKEYRQRLPASITTRVKATIASVTVDRTVMQAAVVSSAQAHSCLVCAMQQFDI
jgi:hypothetical protein